MSTTVTGLSADRLFHSWSTHVLTTGTSTSDPIDPSFVFDFRAYDEPSPATSAGPPGSTSNRCAVAPSPAPTGW